MPYDVVVTGGHGFLGRALVKQLCVDAAEGRTNLSKVGVITHEWDLREEGEAFRAISWARPKQVYHLAATCGGIGANDANPVTFFRDNMLMGLHVMEACYRMEVEKLLVVGTTCSYPKTTPAPFRPADLWSGYPEETNAPYGVAKRALATLGEAYRKQYGFDVIHVIPANLYGPGDNFDRDTSHVIPALIRKMIEAKRDGASTVELWGDGSPTRDFLHVEDAARGLTHLMGVYNKTDPINLGTGRAVRIADLAATIAEIVGFEGRLLWDVTRPNGQPYRQLDSTIAHHYGWRSRVPLRRGLEQTVSWYLEHGHGGDDGNAHRANTGCG